MKNWLVKWALAQSLVLTIIIITLTSLQAFHNRYGRFILLSKAIPVEDVAESYVDDDGYITIKLKDVAYQLDDKRNASYKELLGLEDQR